MLLQLVYVNTTALILMAIATTWFVLHKDINEGSLIKLGLVLVIFGLGAGAYHLTTLLDDPATASVKGLVASLTACNLGILIAGLGVVVRLQDDPRVAEVARRVTDFNDLPS